MDAPILSAEVLRTLLSYDPNTGLFTRRKDSKVLGYVRANGYLAIPVKSQLHSAHRLAWLYIHGSWPDDQIDHINRDKHDNRLCNLREITSAENKQNLGLLSSNTSGFRGVHFDNKKKRWIAKIGVNKRIHSLGSFASAEEAAEAYRLAKPVFHPAYSK